MSSASPRRLLAVDIGNSSSQIGLFVDGALKRDWRISSSLSRTADELHHLIASFIREASLGDPGGAHAVLCSVVPTLTRSFQTALAGLTGGSTLVVDGRLDLGVANLYADPTEVGPDRLVNAVAALAYYQVPAVVVDLGTATTFDVVSAAGEYVGGAIAPGLRTAADVLFQRASRLPRVELEVPPSAIGRTTTESIQAGLVRGAAILIDGLVDEIHQELGAKPTVIATGGDAALLEGLTRRVDVIDLTLTLRGLEAIYRRQRPGD